MIQFGLRAHDIGKLPAEELADALLAFRPASIQLALAKALSDSPSKTGMLSPGYARRIRDIFASRGIGIAVLGCYINPVHPDPDERERALLRFEEHLAFARDFGCAVVGTETGSRNADCSFHPDTQNEETFDLLCRSVERLARTAEKFGSIVGIEAVAGAHTISGIEAMQRLLERIDSPNVRVIYDPVNLIPVEGLAESQEAFFARAFDAFGPCMAAVHVKDFRMENGKKKGDLPAGTGDFDFPSFFRIVQERKPFIDVLLENGNPATLEATLASLRKTAEENRP